MAGAQSLIECDVGVTIRQAAVSCYTWGLRSNCGIGTGQKKWPDMETDDVRPKAEICY